MTTNKHQELPQIAIVSVSRERWQEMDQTERAIQFESARAVLDEISARDIKWWAVRQMEELGSIVRYSEISAEDARGLAMQAMTCGFSYGRPVVA